MFRRKGTDSTCCSVENTYLARKPISGLIPVRLGSSVAPAASGADFINSPMRTRFQKLFICAAVFFWLRASRHR
jgi:hypothetical protein